MKHTVKNTHGKFVYGDKHIDKIIHMLDRGYASTIIADHKVSIVSDGVELVKGKPERITIVEVVKC